MEPNAFDRDVAVLPDRKTHLEYAFSQAPPHGLVVEFGVHTGTSLTRLAEMAGPHHRLLGFDSFRGLPEDWDTTERGDGKHPKGKFDTGGRIPKVPQQCSLIAGWFDVTAPILTAMVMSGELQIALLHIDSDLFSSAMTALSAAAPGLKPGSIVVFDELGNWDGRYPLYREGEWMAVENFLNLYPEIQLVPISRSVAQQAAFRIARAGELPGSPGADARA